MAKYYDISLWEYIKDPGKKSLNIEELASKYLDMRKTILWDFDKKLVYFSWLDSKTQSLFEAEELYVLNEIFNIHKSQNIGNDKILQEIEIPLLLVLKNMELAGVKIDTKKLQDIKQTLEKEIDFEEKMIHTIAGENFNIKSPKQVWVILFEKLWLPSWKKTKTGYSVDTEVLEGLAFEHPIAKHLLNYRGYTKLLSTYVDGLIPLVDDKTWKIHTTYNQAVTATGRLSSTNPNLQNIPSSSSWISALIREAFIPFEENDVIMAFDYSQIEVRLLAIMSEDENMCDSFNLWLDIHASTGYFLFAKDDLTSDERRIAKAVNFWVIYWISPFWLAKMIWISQAEARIYIDKFYEKYPKIWIYFNKIIAECEKTWFVETMFGRKRLISWINDRNQMIKKHSEREAMNMPIQWTAADIIKIAMIKIDDFITKNNYKSRMIMQVHDELVFNVVPWEIDIFGKEIPNIMENIIEWKVKLKVEGWSGKSWKEAK